LRINSFDLHLVGKQQYEVEVYSKAGQAKDSPQGSGGWTEMCKSRVQGQGLKSTTVIPSQDCDPVEINGNQFQTFYITVVGIGDMVVARTNVTTGTENSDLLIRPGAAVTYFDTVRYDNYVFDGGVRYSLINTTTTNNACKDDTKTNVYIHELVGERSCAWLAENMNRFRFACTLAVPAFHCPVACGLCTSAAAAAAGASE
jgi:hypothetical protein